MLETEKLAAGEDVVGAWWPSSAPSSRRIGTLRSKIGSGFDLEVIHDGRDSAKDSNWSPETHDLILGLLQDGRQVALIDAVQMGSGGHATIGSTTYHAFNVISGFRELTPGNIRFGEVMFQFSHMEEWLALPYVKVDNEYFGEDLVGANIRFNRPLDVEKAFDDYGIAFGFFVGYGTSSKRRNFSLSVHPSLVVKFSEPRSLKEIHKLQFQLTGLFSLMIGVPVHLEQRKLIQDENVILWHHNQPKQDIKSISPKQIAGAGEGGAEFFEIAKAWLGRRDELTNVFTLFFSSYLRPDLYVETHFLTMVQALEVFHRRILEVSAESKRAQLDTFLETVSASMRDLPDDLANEVKQAIGYCKGPGLVRRIEETISRLDRELVERFIGDIPSFVRDVKNLRNYRTHFEPRLEAKVVKDLDKICLMVDQLRFVVVANLLIVLGIDGEKLDDILYTRFHFLEGWRKRLIDIGKTSSR